jgi:hypothetical protein
MNVLDDHVEPDIFPTPTVDTQTTCPKHRSEEIAESLIRSFS